jgi:hypothetical protein
MRYTLWSRGRLLGHAELSYVRVMPKFRIGDFFPNPAGEKLMPIATGLSPAMMELARASREAREGSETGARPRASERLELLRQTTEHADFAAAEAHISALELELRGPDGSVIPTESIGIKDTHFLLSLASDDELGDGLSGELGGYDPALEAAIEADLAVLAELRAELDEGCEWDPPEEIEFPRYQIQVQLLDDSAIP